MARAGTQKYWDIAFGNNRSNHRTITTKESRQKYFWVRGLPTAKVADGEKRKLPGIYKITGTKTYTTAMGGQNTVYVFEPFDKQKYFGQMKQEFRKKLKTYMEGD